jgi:hypothetical protein
VDHALDQLGTALDHLVKVVDDGGLDHYDLPGLVGFLQGFEAVRNRLALVDLWAISDAERRGVADAVTQPSMVRALSHVLRLSAGGGVAAGAGRRGSTGRRTPGSRPRSAVRI